MTGLIEAHVTKKIVWDRHLITLELDIAPAPFTAGQFFNLALEINGEMIRRSYSAASAPGKALQFFLSEVKDGALTPSVFALKEGDAIRVDPQALGFFTLAHVPDAKTLWMVATGTGLGPYISLLREGAVFDRFERIVVVHGARHGAELAYGDELRTLRESRPTFRYVPCLSGGGEGAPSDSLSGRITTLFESGALEAQVGAKFEQSSHMLLCGNPQMIEDMCGLLKARGFEKHRKRQPGHFTFEKYWA